MEFIYLLLTELTRLIPPPTGANHNVTLSDLERDRLCVTLVEGEHTRQFRSYHVEIDGGKTPHEMAMDLFIDHNKRVIDKIIDIATKGK